MAATTLTVYAYGNVDALHAVFNAVAMVVSSSDFADMIKVAVIIGFAVVATLAMFPDQLRRGWNWFIGVAVVTSLLLVPKADVTLVDRLGYEAPRVVADVPWTLALMASVKTTFGETLTSLVETATQVIPTPSLVMPAELSYMNHGVMFGARLVRASREAELLSLYDSGDLTNYLMNCVFPERGRSFLASAIETSTDLATLLAPTNPAFSSSYHDPGAGFALVTTTCPNVWTALSPRLTAASNQAVTRAAASVLPDLYRINPAAATAEVSAGLPSIYMKSLIGTAATTASDIMLQNILISSIADASQLYSASLGDPSLVMYSAMRSNAVQGMNAGNLVQGRIAEEALPILRNVTEAVLYLCFPILCILLVASEGRSLGLLFKSYVYALLWVELWPPMFAIVSYLQTLELGKQVAGAAYTAGGGTGLNLATASGIYSSAVSGVATASWMITFVPVLAAAALFGFDRVMSITGAMAGGQKAADSEASGWTKGNVSAGNVSFGQQQLAAYRSDPAMLTTVGVGGTQSRDVLSGEVLNQYASARLPVSLRDTQVIGTAFSKQASVATEAATQAHKAFESSVDAAFTTARSASQRHAESASRTLGWDVSKVGQDGLLTGEENAVAERIATSHGISDTSQVAKALSLGLKGLPMQIPLIGMEGSTRETESLHSDISAGVDALRRTGAQRKVELVDAFRRSEGFDETRRSDREAAERVESSMREATRFSQAESAQLARSESLRENWEAAQRFAREYSADWSNLLDREFQRRGYSVHHGVADPRRMMDTLVDIVASGSLRRDTTDGHAMWIPPDPGTAPNNVNEADLGQIVSGGRDALVDGFRSASPGGGASTVRAVDAAYGRRESAREGALGVSPASAVTGGSVVQAVQEGQERTREKSIQSELATASGQGGAQLALDNRASKVSTLHVPVGKEPSANKALAAVQAREGPAHPFGAEGNEEGRRRAAPHLPEGPLPEIPK